MTKTLPAAETMISSLEWRYAVKKFDPAKRVSEETWASLERSMVLSPSSYGLQPWKFVVITDQGIKDKLPEISWNQTQPRDCSHMVVIASKLGIGPAEVERYTAYIASVRNMPEAALADYKKMMLGTVSSTPADKRDEWCARQCYIALGFLMSACAMLGVDACPMEGIVGEKYDELLGLKKIGYRAAVGCAVGYRAADDPIAGFKKVRYPARELVVRI